MATDGEDMASWQTENLVPFGRYHLGARIATGGMGEVYLAKMKGAAGFEKRVVIKKILPQLSRDPEFVKRFIDEGKLVVKLNHANIVPVLDLGEVGGEYYLAMDFVDGGDLRNLLKRLATRGDLTRDRDNAVPTRLATFILKETCKGLAYAHNRSGDDGRPLGIIHRDISPSNIVVSRDGAVRILDFGIAKASDSLAHSVTGALQGKFLYMSPEQARGAKLDPRSDLFSLGSVAYELLTGVRPFEGRSDLETLELVRAAQPRPILDLAPELPERLAELVHACLMPQPEDRPASAEALQHSLEQVLFSFDEPTSEAQLGAWVTGVLETTPHPDAVAGLSLDDLLSEQLDRAALSSQNRERTQTREASSLAIATPTPPPTPTTSTSTTTATQTVATSTNRLLIAGLLVIIGVLLYFNVRSLTENRTPPAPAPADAQATTPVVTPDREVMSPPPDVVAPRTVETRPDVRPPSEDVSVAVSKDVPDPALPASVRSIQLTGVPGDAVVLVEDKPVEMGTSGIIEVPLDVPITIEVQQAGHAPFTQTIAAGRAPAVIEVETRPLRRHVLVKTTPTGATIEADGRTLGPSPRRVPVTFGRNAAVHANLEGYAEARVSLRYDGPSSVTIKLRPVTPTNPGHVLLRVYPADAIVTIDGRAVTTGSSNRVDRELSPGRHTLVVRSLDGHREKRRAFTIHAGKTNRLGTFDVTGDLPSGAPGDTPTPPKADTP